MYMRFVCWCVNVIYDSNVYPKLSTCTLMGYLTTTPMNNKTTRINSILRHISVIDGHSASVTDNVNFSDFTNAL